VRTSERWDATSRYRSLRSFAVELSVFDACCEGVPFSGVEGEHRAGTVLGVPHEERVAVRCALDAHLDTVPVAGAVAGLTPPHVGEVHFFAFSSSRAVDAPRCTVPNPNYPSQSRRFFQVWLPCKLPCRADHPV